MRRDKRERKEKENAVERDCPGARLPAASAASGRSECEDPQAGYTG